jgi:hypothetical protein
MVAVTMHAAIVHSGKSASVAEQFADQAPDPLPDLVADRPHRIDSLPGRIVQLPVEVTLARKQQAGIPAPHRDDDVGGHGCLVGEELRRLSREVDPGLGHRLDGRWVHGVGRGGSSRAGPSRGRPRDGRGSRRPSGSGLRCGGRRTTRRACQSSRQTHHCSSHSGSGRGDAAEVVHLGLSSFGGGRPDTAEPLKDMQTTQNRWSDHSAGG